MATKNTTAPRLEVRGIRKTFGQNAVLKGINLSVDAGEVVALIGGNAPGLRGRDAIQGMAFGPSPFSFWACDGIGGKLCRRRSRSGDVMKVLKATPGASTPAASATSSRKARRSTAVRSGGLSPALP